MSKSDEASTSRSWFIADTPVSEAERDAFGHPDVANNLLTMLKEPHEGRRMIGLLGSFGVGKSSVVELLGKLLAGDREHALIRVSAERHEIENFHRSFVFSVAEAIVDRDLATRSQVEKIISRLEYSTTQSWSDVRLSGVGRLITFISGRLRSRLGKALAITGGVVVITLGVLTAILVSNGFFATDTAARAITWVTAVISGIATTLTAVPLVSFFRKAEKHVEFFKPGQSTSMRPRAEAADEYERVFASLADLVKSRLVIAVDDVDRLDQHEILPALNAIRSFQLTVPRSKQPTFIVSLDDTIIAKALVAERVERAPGGQENADVLIDEYLNRLFTLRQVMPLHARRDLRSYARELSVGHRGADKLGASLETVLNILIHDGVESPRHVIRLLNAFFADYRLAIRREQNTDGRRAISSGLVTSAPAVLARMTVLKNDYPSFFNALVLDTRLLTTVESDVRGVLKENEIAELRDSIGLGEDTATYVSLKRFIGRTATWTESIDDLLPFLYLGQDRLERSMGSADARRALSALSNRQVAEFADLLTEAAAAPAEQRESWTESIVDATRSLSGLELANALATMAENASAASGLSAEIAAAFADGIVQAPSTFLRTDGLAIMLEAVSSVKHKDEIARAIAEVPTGDDRETWIASVLNADAKIRSYGPAIAKVRVAFGEAMTDVVAEGRLDELESYVGRLRADSDAELADIVLSSTLNAFAQSEEDLTEPFVQTAITAAAPLPSHALSPSLKSAAMAAIRRGVTTNGARVALEIVRTVDVNNPQQLADLAYAWVGSATTSARDALANGFKQNNIADATWLLTRAIRIAPGFTAAWGSGKKVPIPLQISQVLSMHIDAEETIYPAGNEIVAALLEKRPSDLTPVVLSAARLLATATEELDDDERALLEQILRSSDKISDDGLLPLQSSMGRSLLPTAEQTLRDQVIAFLPIVREDVDWATWLESTIVGAVAAADQTATSVQIASKVVLAASPSVPSDASAAAVFDLVRAKMLPYRHHALAIDTVGAFSWPGDRLQEALSVIAPILAEGTDEAIEGAVTQLAKLPRGSLATNALSQFHSIASNRLEHAPAIQSMVIPHLPLDDAFDLALDIGARAQDDFIDALEQATTDEVADWVSGVPALWSAMSSSTPDGRQLLRVTAQKQEEAFAEAVIELVSDSIESDDSALVPERLGELVEASTRSVKPVAEALEAGLQGAAHEVLPAARLAAAVGTSAALDESLAQTLAETVWRWSREELDRDLSLRVARSAREGSLSRAAVLKKIGPRGPVKEPAKGIYLDVKQALS
ncbi:P-loop NTPase fold protein [Microbacterium hydrocarbonoxydans]|uniref:P-loop NTPase fold protein n=1 Tax=Microbacterium hydrocarbonoxydans TaxID=273678 RepID=UPI003D9620EF